jgi:hypothetical protein
MNDKREPTSAVGGCGLDGAKGEGGISRRQRIFIYVNTVAALHKDWATSCHCGAR